MDSHRPKPYRPPTTAQELISRYCEGEHSFPRTRQVMKPSRSQCQASIYVTRPFGLSSTTSTCRELASEKVVPRISFPSDSTTTSFDLTAPSTPRLSKQFATALSPISRTLTQTLTSSIVLFNT